MARPPEPLFVQRRNYRLRRLGDAGKLLPLVGLALFLMPILWAGEGSTAGGMVYLFTVWAGLILVVAFLSRWLSLATSEDNKGPSEDKS